MTSKTKQPKEKTKPTIKATAEVESGTKPRRTTEIKPERQAQAKSPRPKKTQHSSERLSALEAAAKVLKEHGRPMSCGEMVDAMLKRGLWSTNGKTPSATLYSALLRQIETKGKDAQFRKVERGKFALSK